MAPPVRFFGEVSIERQERRALKPTSASNRIKMTGPAVSVEDLAEGVREIQTWLNEQGVSTKAQDELKHLWLAVEEDDDLEVMIAVFDAFVERNPPDESFVFEPDKKYDQQDGQQDCQKDDEQGDEQVDEQGDQQDCQKDGQKDDSISSEMSTVNYNVIPDQEVTQEAVPYLLTMANSTLEEAEGEILVLRDKLAQLELRMQTMRRDNRALNIDMAHVLSLALDGKNVCDYAHEIPNISFREYMLSLMRNRRLGNAIVTPVTPPSAGEEEMDETVRGSETGPVTLTTDNDDYQERFRFIRGSGHAKDSCKGEAT